MDKLPETHRRQIEDSKIESLRRAGIPADAIDKPLADIEGGDAVGEFLKENAPGLFRRGSVTLFETKGAGGLRLLYATARILHLKSISVRRVELIDLVRWVENREYDEIDTLLEPHVLFIERFFEAGNRPVDKPMTAYQCKQIESTVLKRVGHGKASVLHIHNPTKGLPQMTNWWSDSFLHLITNDKVELKVGR